MGISKADVSYFKVRVLKVFGFLILTFPVQQVLADTFDFDWKAREHLPQR